MTTALAPQQFYIAIWLWNMNNPNISAALAPLRASLEVRTVPDFSMDECTQTAGCYSMGLCSSGDFVPKTHACIQCIHSFKKNTLWGKTETRKVQKRNTVNNCYWNSTSKPLGLIHLMAACCRFVLKKDHPRTSPRNRALDISHQHLPLHHPSAGSSTLPEEPGWILASARSPGLWIQ